MNVQPEYERSLSPEQAFVAFMIDKHWSEIHHQENQRSQVAGFLLAAAGATLVLVSERDVTENPHRWLAAGIAVVILGIIGLVSSAKFTERQRFCQNRINRFYEWFDKQLPSLSYVQLKTQADEQYTAEQDNRPSSHSSAWNRVRKWNLVKVWMLLHLAVVAAGIGMMYTACQEISQVEEGVRFTGCPEPQPAS